MKLLGYDIIKIQNKLVEDKSHQKKVGEEPLTKKQTFEVFNDSVKLRLALDQANSLGNFNREQLHEVYRQTWRDTHLQSQWNTRKLKTIHREWKLVDNAENENDDLTELLDSTWFIKFIEFALDSKMWGFSLIQFGVWQDATFNQFKIGREVRDDVYVVDRDYVKPEFGEIMETSSSIEGVSFWDHKFWSVFVGESHYLGMLEALSEIILFKSNAIRNWSEWAEVFGMDVRYAKSDKTGLERNKLLAAIQNLGSNGTGVLSPEDELIFAGTSKSDAFKVYNELIRYVDEQISKIIFGQDVVSNNTGQVVGKTGENIAKLYGNSDAKFIRSVVNGSLLPFLTRIGVADFSGVIFEYDTSEELTLDERADIDLKIAQMGMKHSEVYINDTYGTDVQEVENDDLETAAAIQNLYKDVQ